MARAKQKNDATDDVLDVERVVAEVREALAEVSEPTRAAEVKRYLKSDLAFMGATLPDIRRIAKTVARAHPTVDVETLRALVTLLWDSEVHELRSVAIGVLEAKVRLLSIGDAPFVLALVRTSKTWAYVDWIATKILGNVFDRDPKLGASVDRWAVDSDFWVRRTALLVFHDALSRGEGDFDHFTRLAVPMLGEREFFIRKAIGWVLRATTKRGPQRTITFVERHAAAMSGLSFKEATRNLPENTQARLRKLRDT